MIPLIAYSSYNLYTPGPLSINNETVSLIKQFHIVKKDFPADFELRWILFTNDRLILKQQTPNFTLKFTYRLSSKHRYTDKKDALLCAFLHVNAAEENWGQHRVSSSLLPSLWPCCSLTWLDWLESLRDPQASASPEFGLQLLSTTYVFSSAYWDFTKVLSFARQTGYWLSHFPSPTTLLLIDRSIGEGTLLADIFEIYSAYRYITLLRNPTIGGKALLLPLLAFFNKSRQTPETSEMQLFPQAGKTNESFKKCVCHLEL